MLFATSSAELVGLSCYWCTLHDDFFLHNEIGEVYALFVVTRV